MKNVILFALTALAACPALADAGRLTIGVSGFAEVVRNEQGVRDLKEMGADFASGIPWKDRATLDLFARHGLTAVVNGLPGWWGGKTAWAGLMAEKRPLSAFEKKAAEWQDHPAIRAVVVGDEPSKLDFAHYGKVFDLVRAKMPGAKPVVTILPDYGSLVKIGDEEARRQLGADSYEDYVRSFCETVSADQLDMDFYPYSAPAETRAAYFLRRYRDMAVVARAARDYGKTIGFYVQANSVFKELSMDLAKMRYMAFTALAFGADSLKFTCYTPSWWENNILTKEGAKTPRYFAVQKLISELRSFDREYCRFRCTGTRFVGFPADEIAAIGDAADVRWFDSTALRGLKAADGGRLVVGEMKARDGKGETALLVASADDPEGTNAHVRVVTFRGPDGVKAWNREGPVEPTRRPNGSYSLELPSDGVLLVTAPEPENPLRPRANADDQIRRMSPPLPELAKEIAGLGFNNFSSGAGARFDLSANTEFPDENAATVRRQLADAAALGVDQVVSIGWARDKKLSKAYPRLDRAGKPVQGRTEKGPMELDAAHPEAQRIYREATMSFAKKVADSPDFAGFRPFGEIRLRSTPSFTDYNAAAYRADTGREIPAEAKGRAAPSWKTLRDLPANRVVSEHHPVLAFYRWFWQKGDGWTTLDEVAVDAFADATGGRRTFTEYEPCLRIPPLLGIAGAVSHIGNWIYSYDDPVNCDYPIAKSFASARGTPGQQVLTGLQLITHRERIAGKNGSAANEPEWTRKYPNCAYPNMPADLLRIGLWTCFSRRHEGASFHSWQCLFDGEKYGVDPNGKGYQFTDPDLVKGLAKFFHEVAEPLGPLFRAVPERPAEVVVFESWASAILSGTAPAFWELAPLDCGVAATAANLMPGCLFAEELQRDGVPASVKVMLLPMCQVVTESTYVKLRAFQRRGGKLIATEDLAPALKADALLPENPTKTYRAKAAKKEADFRAQAKKLRATVERFCEPAVGSDNPFIHVHARGEGAYDLLFAVNDRRGPGPYAGVWELVLDKGLPTEGAVTLRRDAKAVYDLVLHERVTDFSVRDGRLSIPLRLDGAEGRVFLVCDRPLAPLEATAEGGKVTVRTADKDVMVPIQVVAEGRKPYSGVVRNGVWSHDFGAAGAFKVVNLADGTAVRAR